MTPIPRLSSLLISLAPKPRPSIPSATPVIQAPLRVTPPTLAPSVPSVVEQTPLEEFVLALLKLEQVMDEEDSPSRKERIEQCVKGLIAKIPDAIDLTKEGYYDIKRFSSNSNGLFFKCFGMICESEEYRQSADALFEFHQKVMAGIVKLPPSREAFDFKFGECLGQTVAHMTQTIPSLDKETEKLGGFFQRAYRVNRVNQGNESIGKYLLDHPQECPFVIHDVAQVLGYAKGKEFDLIKDARNAKAPAPRFIVERMLGSSTRSFRQDVLSVTFRKIINDALHGMGIVDIPLPILRKYNIRKCGMVIEMTPIAEVSGKLKSLKDTKGPFELSLRNQKGEVDHSVFASMDPPSFSDLNDTCPSGQRKVRRFKTLDELLVFLPHYLKAHYQDRYEACSLTLYQKMAKISPSPATEKVEAVVDKTRRREEKKS